MAMSLFDAIARCERWLESKLGKRLIETFLGQVFVQTWRWGWLYFPDERTLLCI